VKNQVNDQALPHRLVDCPRCERAFDVREAKATFMEAVNQREGVVYAMCPPCHGAFEASDTAGQKKMGIRCLLNRKKTDQDGASGKAWAITTTITLLCHGGNIAAAIWEGIDLPGPIYDAIFDGRLRLTGVGPFLITGRWVDEMEACDDDA
jgi:uncharacterized C2H2 Zn-finger protein